RGDGIRSQKVKSTGFRNLADMSAQLLGSFNTYSASDFMATGYRSIFSVTKRNNPLQSFAFSGIDSLAEKVLNQAKDENITTGNPASLLDAGFVDKLPPTITLAAEPGSDLD